MRPASEREMLEFSGVVKEVRRGCYLVAITAGALRRDALCTLGGRLNMHHIRIVVGDSVTVEVSPYDLTRGRIVYRGQKHDRP